MSDSPTDAEIKKAQAVLSQALTPSVASQRYGIDRKTIYNWIDAGELTPMSASGGTVTVWEPQLITVLQGHGKWSDGVEQAKKAS